MPTHLHDELGGRAEAPWGIEADVIARLPTIAPQALDRQRGV
jgi:hypothetical protein